MFDCLVCSPPYAESITAIVKDLTVKAQRLEEAGIDAKRWLGNKRCSQLRNEHYGTTFGQLGAMKPGSPCETPMNEVETLSWDKDTCYGASWQGLITPESFAHPAKMARGQLFRLIKWLFETGRVKKGDVLCDPFGGVSTTAIAGASAGLKVVTCELEPKFHALALENMEIHRRVWEAAGDPQPVILQGDSRKLAEVVGPVLAQCVLSSPPYAASLHLNESQEVQTARLAAKGNHSAIAKMSGHSASGNQGYDATPGNLGNLPPGDALASGVVSSPPWEGVLQDHDTKENYMKQGCGRLGKSVGNSYGNTSGETFWDAARTILQQCHLLLKPGATTCWVVKSYVKAGAIVPFPGQWAALLEATGFQVTHRIRCHLVSETREADLFGGETVKRKERKSFFRRLHEKKSPHTRIDFEEIVVAVKVGEGGSVGAAVSSPPYASGEKGHPSLGSVNKDDWGTDGRDIAFRRGVNGEYGRTAGQLGGLPPGEAPAPRRCNQCGKGDDGCQCCFPEE